MHGASGARRRHKVREIFGRLRRCSITMATKETASEKKTILLLEMLFWFFRLLLLVIFRL